MPTIPKKVSRRDFLILFCIVLIDMIGIGIIIPVLPTIMYESLGLSTASAGMLFGLLIAVYPIAQFFGAPLLGALSDKHGRKKVLALSLVGTVMGYIIFGLGVVLSNISLLFVGRIIDGLTGGNISVAQSAIADISSKKDKPKNFGMIGMAFGVGFIIGPFVGGLLSNPELVSWFSKSTPFFASAILATLNLLVLSVFFKETLHTRISRHVDLKSSFRQIKKAFTHPLVKYLFIVVFFLNLGWSHYTQFFQILLHQKFSYTPSQIGNYFAYIGLCIALAQGVFVRMISKRFQPRAIIRVALPLIALIIVVMINVPFVYLLYLIIPFMAISFGLAAPNLLTLISNSVPSTEQGEVMGIQQSVNAMAFAVAPLFAGFALAINVLIPLYLGVFLILTSAVLFWKLA